MVKTTELTLTKMGNARGVRLPANVIRRYGFSNTLLAELREEGLLLKSGESEKLSWEETVNEMVASGEDWSEWDNFAADGLEACPWDYPIPAAVKAWAKKSAERERRAIKTRRRRAKK